ncbi:galactose mutarotase [Synechococcus sp. UW179A]|uniref:aldose epimerase family protein n=1 Tax=Synechococcus sp. UW179A TaxID=2575510 RepID=UPI00148256AC|nr:galactose mutarotase [Synechococcus sp. UW179A]
MTFRQQSAPYPHWEFVNPSRGDRLRVVPERGGLVTEWSCNGREMLYFDQERFADPAKSIRGGIPVLFPICGNLPNDCLPLASGDFTLKQHGFARDLPWQIALLGDQSGVMLTLSDGAETRKVYPFGFRIQMEIRPLSDALDIIITISNTSESESEPMPFSFGLHPYFNVSDPSRTAVEGLPGRCFNHLEMAEAQTANQLNRLAQGVDFLTHAAGPVTLVDEQAGTRLQLRHQEPMDLTVVWTDPPRAMVCLEPWTGPRQALISGDRRLELGVGESTTLSCRYSVS